MGRMQSCGDWGVVGMAHLHSGDGSSIHPKVLQYEAFVNERLKPDLQRSMEAAARLQAELADYDALEENLCEIKQSGRGSLKMQVDMGGEVLCQAYVPDTSKVFIRVGLGFHLECTLDEAPRVIQLQRGVLQAKEQNVRSQSAKIRAHIKMVEEGLRELMHLTERAT